jgi:hypothetical protein
MTTVSIIVDGQLKGAFKGFKDRETVFEFFGGGKWRQNEYKYQYHYAYKPRAKVIDRSGAYYLQVDGIAESVQVVRVR